MINALEINNLKKTYNTEHGEINAIYNINLTIKKGEFIAIVGPSGCGKSTLLSILAGLEKPTDGSFKYDKDNPVIGSLSLIHISEPMRPY